MPLDSELEYSVAMMAKVCGCWSPSFSPDGKQLAFVSDMNGIPQVWTVAAEGGWPTLVTALNDQVVKVIWSPDGEWLAFNVAPGGGMNQQIYCIRPDGTDLRLLTDGGSETNWLHFWTKDSRRIAIASNRANRSAMDAYLLDISSGEYTLAAHNPGIGRLTDVHAGTGRMALYRMANRSDSNLYLLEQQTERLLTPHEWPGNFANARFSPDGGTIYLQSDHNRDKAAFARIVIGSWEIEVIAGRDDAELENYAVSDDGTTAALLWNVYGRSELAFVDLSTGVVTPAPALPAEIIMEASFSADGRLLTFRATGAAAPDDIWILNRDTGALTQVTHSPHPGVNLNTLIRPKLATSR